MIKWDESLIFVSFLNSFVPIIIVIIIIIESNMAHCKSVYVARTKLI